MEEDKGGMCTQQEEGARDTNDVIYNFEVENNIIYYT